METSSRTVSPGQDLHHHARTDKGSIVPWDSLWVSTYEDQVGICVIRTDGWPLPSRCQWAPLHVAVASRLLAIRSAGRYWRVPNIRESLVVLHAGPCPCSEPRFRLRFRFSRGRDFVFLCFFFIPPHTTDTLVVKGAD